MTSLLTKKINTVLITGASSGIGLQLAKDYLALGWHVIACGRDASKLDLLAQKELIGATCLSFDISDRVQVQQAATELGDMLSSSECLLDMGYCLGAFLPLMPKGSKLALMSSSAIYLPFPRAEAYGASKAGVKYLAASLSLDVAQDDIRVSVICPGFVATPLTAKNDFAMPMQIDVHEASLAIRVGIERGDAEIHFPKRFTYLLKLMSFLPAFVWQKMIQRDSQAKALKDTGR